MHARVVCRVCVCEKGEDGGVSAWCSGQSVQQSTGLLLCRRPGHAALRSRGYLTGFNAANRDEQMKGEVLLTKTTRRTKMNENE